MERIFPGPGFHTMSPAIIKASLINGKKVHILKKKVT